MKKRNFIKTALGLSAGMLIAPHVSGKIHSSLTIPFPGNNQIFSPWSIPLQGRSQTPRIRFSVIGLNHSHIYGLVSLAIRGGGELVAFHAKEDDLAATFTKRFPHAKRVSTETEILEDNTIQLVVSASIPNERASLGKRVMEHGKDFMVDKPGVTSLSQLAAVRKVQKKTGRFYAIVYGRLESKTLAKAHELIQAGAIGKVVQTVSLGPHRLSPQDRAAWFYDKKYFGGILCDIGSHLFEEFLYLTGSTSAKVLASQTGNVNFPQYKDFEDFGDAMIQGNSGPSGYLRVDWFTPDGLQTWGDGRLTILGTDGYIEIRNNIDIAGRKGGNHFFLVDQKSTQYIDCNNVDISFDRKFVDDIINRTETAMSQEHCFLATELTLQAQKKAIKMG